MEFKNVFIWLFVMCIVLGILIASAVGILLYYSGVLQINIGGL